MKRYTPQEIDKAFTLALHNDIIDEMMQIETPNKLLMLGLYTSSVMRALKDYFLNGEDITIELITKALDDAVEDDMLCDAIRIDPTPYILLLAAFSSVTEKELKNMN